MTLKKIWLIVSLFLFVSSGRAEDLSVKDVFCQMPDSLLPSLSANNRLDMIDFIDSGMTAEVRNLLNGTSQMTALTDDGLTVCVSDALTIHLLLLKPEIPLDSCNQVLCLVQSVGTDSLSLSTTIDYYTVNWQRLEAKPHLSEADRHKMDLLNVQTILKWRRNILKKD